MKKRLVLIVLADVVPNLALGFLIGHVYPELVDDKTGAMEISTCGFTRREMKSDFRPNLQTI